MLAKRCFVATQSRVHRLFVTAETSGKLNNPQLTASRQICTKPSFGVVANASRTKTAIMSCHEVTLCDIPSLGCLDRLENFSKTTFQEASLVTIKIDNNTAVEVLRRLDMAGLRDEAIRVVGVFEKLGVLEQTEEMWLIMDRIYSYLPQTDHSKVR